MTIPDKIKALPLPPAAMVETNPYGEPGTLEWYDAAQLLALLDAAAALAAEHEARAQALADALEGLDDAYCRADTALSRNERTEDRNRLIAARAALRAWKESQ